MCIRHSRVQALAQVGFGGDGIKKLCESPCYEVFNAAFQGLLKPRQDGRFIFDLEFADLSLTAAEVRDLDQKEYDVLLKYLSLLSAVRCDFGRETESQIRMWTCVARRMHAESHPASRPTVYLDI
jgi:hypothetical protein